MSNKSKVYVDIYDGEVESIYILPSDYRVQRRQLWLQEISPDPQYFAETEIYQIGEIDLTSGEMTPCTPRLVLKPATLKIL